MTVDCACPSRWKGTTTAMSIAALSHRFVVGVDTHARKHVYTILTSSTGDVVATNDIPTTVAGQPGTSLGRTPPWRRCRHHVGHRRCCLLWCNSHRTVVSHGYPVAEAPRMDARQRRGIGTHPMWSMFTASLKPFCHYLSTNCANHASTSAFDKPFKSLSLHARP